jgi:general secretion pathway protein K
VLATFFAGLGAAKATAMEDAERVIGWRTRPAPGSNDEEARYAALGYPPRQSLFVDVNELALVVGLPSALVDRALPFVTIFNGSSDIDDSIAAPEVVAAFKKTGAANDPFGGQMAAGGGLLAGTDPSAPPKSAAPAAKSPCYRIQMTIGFANGRRTASDVVIALGDKAEPYRVLAWQDDVNPVNAPVVRRRS